MPDVCPQHDRISDKLDEVHADVRQILTRLGAGDVDLATLRVRLDTVERLVYGAVTLALTGLGGTIMQLVLK